MPMQTLSLHNPFEGPVFYLPVTTSTMAVARANPEHGAIVRTGLQTEGRGRIAGRAWESSADENLLLTLTLRQDTLPVPLTSVSVRTALALVRVLENDFALQPCIKWPNDVLVHQRKISGILCESSGGYLYIGVGVNCNQKVFPEFQNRRATSLSIEADRDVDTLSLMSLFLPVWKYFLYELKKFELPGEANPKLCTIGRQVEVFEGDPRSGALIRGTAEGIGEAGELRLRQKSGKIRSVYSGE